MKVSKALEMFQDIFNDSTKDYVLELMASPKNFNTGICSIAIEIKSKKDKEFALDLLDRIYKEYSRQKKEK